MKRRLPFRRQMLQQQQTGVTAGVAIGAAVVGAGTEIYGASEQKTAASEANDANQKNVQTANNESWTNYLMSRGINPGGTVAYGTIPTNGQTINTKLPLWATVNVPNTMSGPGGSNTLASALAPTPLPSVGGVAGGYNPVAGRSSPAPGG